MNFQIKSNGKSKHVVALSIEYQGQCLGVKGNLMRFTSMYKRLAEAYQKENGNWDLVIAHADKYGIPSIFACTQCFELYNYKWVNNGRCCSK